MRIDSLRLIYRVQPFLVKSTSAKNPIQSNPVGYIIQNFQRQNTMILYVYRQQGVFIEPPCIQFETINFKKIYISVITSYYTNFTFFFTNKSLKVNDKYFDNLALILDTYNKMLPFFKQTLSKSSKNVAEKTENIKKIPV